MTAAPLDPAAIMAAHTLDEEGWCIECFLWLDKPCETYRLAADLAAERAVRNSSRRALELVKDRMDVIAYEALADAIEDDVPRAGEGT